MDEAEKTGNSDKKAEQNKRVEPEVIGKSRGSKGIPARQCAGDNTEQMRSSEQGLSYSTKNVGPGND